MPDNKTNGLMKWSVILLVICNVGILVTMWMHPHGRHSLPPAPPPQSPPTERPMPAQRLHDALHLTQEQAGKFEEIGAANQQKIDSLKLLAATVRKNYFDGLRGNEGDALSDSLARVLGNLHYEIEKQTYAHFKMMRAVVSDNQKQVFDSILIDILHSMPEQPHVRSEDRPSENRQGPPPRGDRPGPDGPHRHKPPPPPGAPPPPEN